MCAECGVGRQVEVRVLEECEYRKGTCVAIIES